MLLTLFCCGVLIYNHFTLKVSQEPCQEKKHEWILLVWLKSDLGEPRGVYLVCVCLYEMNHSSTCNIKCCCPDGDPHMLQRHLTRTDKNGNQGAVTWQLQTTTTQKRGVLSVPPIQFLFNLHLQEHSRHPKGTTFSQIQAENVSRVDAPPVFCLQCIPTEGEEEPHKKKKVTCVRWRTLLTLYSFGVRSAQGGS